MMARGLSRGTTFKDKVRPDSAVSRWSMDNADLDSGIIKDTWGNNDGTLNGGVMTGVSGVGGGEAFSFDESNDVALGDALDFVSNTNSSTITAWIKTSSASRNPIIAKQSSGSQYADGWSFGSLDSGEIRFSLRDAGSGDHDIGESTATVNDGKWHLVTIVKGSTDI